MSNEPVRDATVGVLRKLAAQERVELILICGEFLQAGGNGYAPEEDAHVLNLAKILHRYTSLRAVLNDHGVNTL